MTAAETLSLIETLAERLVWVAPVGNEETYFGHGPDRKPVPALRGFMVCRRVINNQDGKNTRVDFLRLKGDWKTPFRECECLFPTMEQALLAAAAAENARAADRFLARIPQIRIPPLP